MMDAEELFNKLKTYFPNNSDLMRHLNIHACWEYFITEKSTNKEDFKLRFFLYKKKENHLEMTRNDPNIKPDLILYFTENAILDLIRGNPSAEKYFIRYREIMNNPKPGNEVDNKVNKPRLKLWQIGYKKWQSEFKF
ncbi:MAG: hypothetical protein ACFFB6_11745 [Promethearchaeota archaeon]